MKTTYLFALAVLGLCFSSFTPSQKDKEDKEVAWMKWNEGYEKAGKDGKIIMVDVYTDWCGWCKKMDRETYANAEILSALKKDFVSIKFNPEEEGVTYNVDELKLTGPQLLNMLTQGQRTGFPTIIFIYPKVREVTIQPGYQDPQQFKASLEKVVEQGKTKTGKKKP